MPPQVLPPLRDVNTRPEVGEQLRNKLVRLMTHLDTDVKRVAAEFLFVLCSESGEWEPGWPCTPIRMLPGPLTSAHPAVPRFIKYTGYGNAAGLLAARGLMAGGRPEGQYSEDEDTDTDEYKEARDRYVPHGLGLPHSAPVPIPLGPVGLGGQRDKRSRLFGVWHFLSAVDPDGMFH